MKKTLIALGLCLAFSGFAYSQATEAGAGPRLEIDQYGQLVETLPAEVTVRNGITWIENRERGYRFWFDARVQVDFSNHHRQRNGLLTGPDGMNIPSNQLFLTPELATPHMPGGLQLRRVRFAVKAEINHNWYAEVDFNMANGSFGLQDAYIQFNGLRNWMFRVGNFKEDFSMEYTTSSRFVTMMERPMNVTAFNFTRRLGFQFKYHHEDMPWWRVSGGVTVQEIAGSDLNRNVRGVQREYARGSGPNFTGKFVLMPWATDPNRGLHFGYNIQHRSGRWVSDDYDFETDMPDSRAWHGMRVNTRNAYHLNRTAYLDTRWFRDGVRSNLFQGVELAGFWNGWRFGSEFIWHDMIMDRNLAMFPDFEGATLHARGEHHGFELLSPEELRNIYAQNKRHWGWYAYVGKILFGGQQRYDISQSEFTRPTRGRSWGDIEVLFRYDYINLNNQFRDLPVQVLSANGGGGNQFGQPGGAGHNFTFGVNFWINTNMRFMVNYTISRNDVWANGGGHLNQFGRNPNAPERNIAVGRDANGNFTGDPLSVVSDPGVRFNTLSMRLEIAF
ncbi:MAG: porin [Bacteroidales bacterium]|nr:porin [Bacteroidales bacterium]